MIGLFQKILVFGDTHFGRQSNSSIANQDNLDFLRWAIDAGRTWGADRCIMLGDWHDNRHSLGLATMDASLRGLEMLSAGFKQTWFIPGNHDEFYRDRRDITSIEYAKHIPNITVINDPLTIDGVTFLPWLMPDEHKNLTLDGRYVFGHLEVAGFLRNMKSVMPETAHALTTSIFAKQETAFSGHFHFRQSKNRVLYIGNAMPFDFRDDGDDQRGIMLLEWGHEPIFRAWPEQPLYRSLKLSQLTENRKALKPNMTVRLEVDVPLQYEDAQQLRDAMVAHYGLRKIELCHSRSETDAPDAQEDVALQTVDQIVLHGLEGIESTGLSAQRLIEIYQSLI